LTKLAQALQGTVAAKVAGRVIPPLAVGLTAKDVYDFYTDPRTHQDAAIAEGIYGQHRHPGMYAPGDIERRYIEQQTRGPNVTKVNKTTPDAAMMGYAMENPEKLGYGGRKAIIQALLGQQ